MRVGEPCLLSLGSLLWRGEQGQALTSLPPTKRQGRPLERRSRSCTPFRPTAASVPLQMWFSLLLGTAACAAPHQGRAAAAHLSLDALAASAAWFLAEMDSRIYCWCWLPNPFSQLSVRSNKADGFLLWRLRIVS